MIVWLNKTEERENRVKFLVPTEGSALLWFGSSSQSIPLVTPAGPALASDSPTNYQIFVQGCSVITGIGPAQR